MSIHAAVEAHLLQRVDHGLGCRLAGAARHARGRTVDAVRTGFRCLQISHITQTGGRVCMHINRNFDVLLECGNQIIALLRRHDARHILNAQRVAAHGFDLPAERNEHLQIVDRTQRIADTALCMAACLETFVHSGLDVAQIVQRIENTDDIHAVLDALADKTAHGIIRIMVIAEQVLTAQQHLQLGVLHVRFDLAQTLPRILMQIAQAGIKGRTAPALNRVITGLIHLIENALEILKRHSRRNQRLLRVTQHRFGDVHLFHKYAPSFGK